MPRRTPVLCGFLYAVAAAHPAMAAKYTILHNFGRNQQQYVVPIALTLGPDGAVFGTTNNGGRSGGGSIYRLDPDGTFTTLQAFPIGDYPSTVVLHANTLYAVSPQAGANNLGEVISLGESGAHRHVLHNFANDNQGAHPGFTPNSLVVSSNGTVYGNASIDNENDGYLIYSLAPNGTYTVLQEFPFSAGPPSLLLLDDNHLVLTFSVDTQSGYTNTINLYTLSSNTLTPLYDFGAAAQFIVTSGIDSSKNLYGYTTSRSEAQSQLFKLTASPGGYNFSILDTVPNLISGLTVLGPDSMIGTTSDGDTGSIFRFTNAALTTLHKSHGDRQGANYQSPLQQPNGPILGIASTGGKSGNGVLYALQSR